MKIIFHGAAQEVGKSCIEILTNGSRYILDAGIKFVQGGIEYPKYLDQVYELHAVFLTHAHLDHSGALPMLENKRLNAPIYCTKMTWDTTNLMLEDSYHLAQLKHVHPCYTERDIKEAEKDAFIVEYDKWYETKDKKVKFMYLNAGHIPGSACVLLELEGKRLLYTGDINTEDTLLMKQSKVGELENIDILICENTYGERIHPDREHSEKGLLDAIKVTLDREGSVLLPVFSVGRSQEILMELNKLDTDAKIYLDGMPRKLTDIVLRSKDPYIDNKDILREIMDKVTIVENPKLREKIAKEKGVIIVTSSGMLQGGPVMAYAPIMIRDDKNAVILTGFQANGTRGRSMFEDHLFYDKGQRELVKSTVCKFDFSAHHGQNSIRKLIKDLDPKNIILVHGDLDAVEATKRYSEQTFKGKVYMPQLGQEIEIN